MFALVEIYRHVGERVRRDVKKAPGISESRLAELMGRFDAVKGSGTMLADDGGGGGGGPARTTPSPTRVLGSATSAKKSAKKWSSGISRPNTSKVVGVDPAAFEDEMYNVEPVLCHSESELASEFAKLNKVLPDDKADWTKRVAVTKKMRMLIAGGANEMGNYLELVKDASDTLAAGAKDLRSQVSKETCITLARISTVLSIKFQSVAKVVIPVLLSQVQINVRVLADSANLCMIHILKTCHAHKLLLQLNEARFDRSVTIRRRVYEYFVQVIEEWPVETLKRQVATLSDLVFDGQSDADSEVRKTARVAYWILDAKFPSHAADLMKRLDASKQKQLMKSQDDPMAATLKKPSSSTSTSTSTSTSSSRGSIRRSGTGSATPKRPASSAAVASSRSSTGPKRVSAASSSLSSSGRVDSGRSTGRSGVGAPSRVAGRGPSSMKSSSSKASSSSAPAAAKTVAEELEAIFRQSTSSDWKVRLEGISQLKSVIRGSTAPTQDEVQKIAVYFLDQFAEVHKNVYANVAEALFDFLHIFKDDISDLFVADCLVKLLAKIGSDLNPTGLKKVAAALEMLRVEFSAHMQLLAIFRMLLDKNVKPNVKVKLAQMDFIVHLIPNLELDASVWMATDNLKEFAKGTEKCVEYSNEPRSAELRSSATQVLVDLFEADPPPFGTAMQTMSEDGQIDCAKIFDQQLESGWRQRSNIEGRGSNHLQLRHASTADFDELVAEGSDGESPITDSFDEINSMPSSRTSPVSPTLSHAFSAGSPSPDPEQQQSSQSPTSDEGQPSASPEQQESPLQAAAAAASPPPSPALSASPSSPAAPSFATTIATARSEIANSPDQRQATIGALQVLMQASKDGAADLWDADFEEVMDLVLHVLPDDDPDVRDLALRLLREMLKNQTQYFEGCVGDVIKALLERHSEADRAVLRAAEETLNVLSNVIIPTTCVVILEPVILNDSGSVLLAAIKLLTKVLKKMTLEEMETVADKCIPGIVQGYKHPMAEVRKGVVFALVEMYLTMDAPLMEKLGDLSSSQKKLLMIYIKRAQERLAK